MRFSRPGRYKQGMTAEERTALRRRILAERNRLSPLDLSVRSRAITSRVLDLPEMAQATMIMLYMHFRSEVQTDGLLKEWLARGRTVCVPRVLPRESRLEAVRITDPEQDLAPGYCGILEPSPLLPAAAVLPPSEIQVVIVPGSVFDPLGGRLGYGGGYYDRFLAGKSPQAIRIALAFALQMVAKVPTEPHDQPVDFVVTEEHLYPCRRNRHAQDRRLPR